MNHWVEKYIRIIIRIKEAIRKGLFLISTIIAMHRGAKETFCSLLHPSFLAVLGYNLMHGTVCRRKNKRTFAMPTL